MVQQRMRKRTKKMPAAIVPLALLAVAFVLALLLGSGTTLASRGFAPVELALEDAYLDGPLLQEDGIGIYRANTMAVTFYGVDTPTRTVQVETFAGPDAKTPVTVGVELVQYTSAGQERVTALDSAVVNPAGKNKTVTLRLYSAPGRGAFRLTFSDQIDPFVVTGVTLNKSGFAFNWAQFILFAAVGLFAWLAWRGGWHRVLFNPARRAHRLVFWVSAAVCGAFVVWLLFAVTGRGLPLLLPYNPKNTQELFFNDYYHSQYYQLFDALKNGQLAMRTQPPAQLAALANPYDAVAREGIDYLWDMAYYKGNYYCYYGPAPMPLYFAVYAVLGRLPSGAVACAVPALLVVWFAKGALQELLRYFEIKANLLLLLLAFPALMAGSLLFMLMSCADAYEQPYLWAMAGFTGFVWLLFWGLRTTRPVLRRGLFCLAGIGVVYVAASRPAVLLLCVVFALPPALRMLRQKQRRATAKLLDVLALALPVAAGAALLMAYNYFRFNSPFAFGNTYQLTVGDMTAQTFRLSPVWLAQSMLLFLLWPLQLHTAFPYISAEKSTLQHYGSYFYNYYAMGLLNLPLFWGLLGAGKTLRRQPAVKKGVYIGGVAASVFLLWYTYCVANAVYRYLCDVTLALGLLAVLVLLEVCSCKPAGQRKGLYVGACLVCVATCAVGFLLCFSNERQFIYRFSTDTYIWVARLLGIT